MACLFVAVVLGGGVAAGGWFAYDFYQTHFGPAPDYAGEGSGSVQVEIPQGAGTGEMGRILKGAGVVRSAQAFVDAAGENPKGLSIQPGVYAMKKEMSGEAAVDWMLSRRAATRSSSPRACATRRSTRPSTNGSN